MQPRDHSCPFCEGLQRFEESAPRLPYWMTGWLDVARIIVDAVTRALASANI